MITLIRRSPSHSLVAHVDALESGGVALNRLTPDVGIVPYHDDLVGVEFDRIATLRRVVKDRMRSVAHGEPERNLLDRVMLTPAQYHRWLCLIDDIVVHCSNPDDIPTENAEVLTNGKLRIFVEGYGEMIVPQGDWSWRDQ